MYLVPGCVPGPRGVYQVLGGLSGLEGVPGPGGCLLLGGVPGPGGCTWSEGCTWSQGRGVSVPGVSALGVLWGVCSGGCTWSRGVAATGGYLLLGGVPAPRGMSALRGCVLGLGGVPGPGGVNQVPGGCLLLGVYLV